MPVISGSFPTSPAAPLPNGYITPALDEYSGIVGWPAGASPWPGTPVRPITRVLALAHPRVIGGSLAHAFSDDYYHRIHVAPAALVLGSVVSTQINNVAVWNAYLVPQTLTALGGIEDGIVVTAPGPLPMVFGALQETTWPVSVTTDGPSTIDVSISWVFDGVPSPALRITGQRVVAWTFAPDWTEGVRERLEWRTDVLASPAGAEQRRALRVAPRRSFEARMVLEGRERSMLDLCLAGWGAQIWALPIWPDVQWLSVPIAAGADSIACVTTGRDFHAGGLALLRGDHASSSETVEIEAVAAATLTLKRPTLASWPVGTRVYPVRNARLRDRPTLTRLNDRLSAVEVAFDIDEPCDWPEILPETTYRGAAVFDARPDESEDLTGTWERVAEMLDNGVGRPVLTDTAGTGFSVQGHAWMLYGRTERSAWRSLMYALRGRQKAVWIPTHAADLRLVATASGAVMDIESIGYARFAIGRPGRRDIRIELVSGAVLHRRVINAVEVSGDVERLSIDTAFASPVAPQDVARISFMALCRQMSDSSEIHHLTDADGSARTQSAWRSVRDDLELP